MGPKVCYDDISNRARRLLNLYSSLLDRRKYKMRADWKKGLCKLMHWPKKIDIDRVDSGAAIIIIHKKEDLKAQDFSKKALGDLLRSSLVLGVSAFDRYVHERVTKGVISALRRGKLSKEQKELSVSARVALQAIGKANSAKKAGKTVRPAHDLRDNIQEQLHRMPFQSWSELDNAFKLIGLNVSDLQAMYKLPNLKKYQNGLNQIARKRNQIVHEGDLVRHRKGGKIRPHDIEPGEVKDALDLLDDLVQKLEKLQ